MRAAALSSMQAASIPAVYRVQPGGEVPAGRAVSPGFFWPRTGRSPAAALLADAYRLQSSAGRLTGESPDAVGTPDAIIAQARAFAKAYNALTDQLERGAPEALGGDLLERLRQAYEEQATPLAEAGMTAGRDGQLTLDTTQLAQVLREDPERARQLFQATTGLPLVASAVAEQLTARIATALAAPPARPRPTWTYSRLDALPFTGGQESLKGNLLDLAV